MRVTVKQLWDHPDRPAVWLAAPFFALALFVLVVGQVMVYRMWTRMRVQVDRAELESAGAQEDVITR